MFYNFAEGELRALYCKTFIHGFIANFCTLFYFSVVRCLLNHIVQIDKNGKDLHYELKTQESAVLSIKQSQCKVNSNQLAFATLAKLNGYCLH